MRNTLVWRFPYTSSKSKVEQQCEICPTKAIKTPERRLDNIFNVLLAQQIPDYSSHDVFI